MSFTCERCKTLPIGETMSDVSKVESAAKHSSDTLNLIIDHVHLTGRDYLMALERTEARDAAIRADELGKYARDVSKIESAAAELIHQLNLERRCYSRYAYNRDTGKFDKDLLTIARFLETRDAAVRAEAELAGKREATLATQPLTRREGEPTLEQLEVAKRFAARPFSGCDEAIRTTLAWLLEEREQANEFLTQLHDSQSEVARLQGELDEATDHGRVLAETHRPVIERLRSERDLCILCELLDADHTGDCMTREELVARLADTP